VVVSNLKPVLFALLTVLDPQIVAYSIGQIASEKLKADWNL